MIIANDSPAVIKKPMAKKFLVPGAVILWALGVLYLILSCSSGAKPQTRVEFLLGTACSITVYDRAAPELLSRAFARVKEIEDRMSTGIAAGDIGRINAGAGQRAVSVAEDTFLVVSAALEFARLSGGAFNLAVGPLVSLWGIGTEAARLPRPEEIAAALGRVDYRKVQLDEGARTVYLEEIGMGLDLGAIAKGYAADEAVRILHEGGVERAVIDFGGNIVVMGSHPAGRAWRIGVQNPDQPRGAYLGILEVQETSVVSSGVYERFFTGPDGRRYHHILNSESGYPVDNELSGVTVVSRDSIVADALSTTFFALGLPVGLELAERIEGVEALFITTGRELYATSGLGAILSLSDQSFKLMTE